MQYLTGQLVVSYRTINRFRVAAGMEDLICDLFIELNLRLKMADAGYGSEENLLTLDELGIGPLIKYGLFEQEQNRSRKGAARNHPRTWTIGLR